MCLSCNKLVRMSAVTMICVDFGQMQHNPKSWPDRRVASAARPSWTPPLSFSLIGWLMFLVPVPYRKSLSWNTLRARKRAEAKDASLVGVRGQENGLLRKPKETTPPLPLASPATRAKGKVSKSRPMAHAGDVICVCGNPSPARCPSWFLCFFLTRVCVHACVCADLPTHTQQLLCLPLTPAVVLNLHQTWS